MPLRERPQCGSATERRDRAPTTDRQFESGDSRPAWRLGTRRVKPVSRQRTPEAQLRSFITRFDPKEQKLIRSVRAAVRKRFPTANELAYDYSKFFVISYSPTDRAIDAVAAIAARPGGVRLYLMHGPQLPDPKKLLLGSGKQTRFLLLEAAGRLAHPDVEALIAAATDRAKVPLKSSGTSRLIMKAGAAKQPPRGKPTKRTREK
jgi:hypothetical protein